MPELAINQGCFYILKYIPEKKECKILYSEQSSYFEGIIGTGQLWYHDGQHANVIRDRYIVFDGESSWDVLFDLEQGLEPESLYYSIGTSTHSSDHIQVDKELWNELTKPFFEATENVLLPQSFQEVFVEVYE